MDKHLESDTLQIIMTMAVCAGNVDGVTGNQLLHARLYGCGLESIRLRIARHIGLDDIIPMKGLIDAKFTSELVGNGDPFRKATHKDVADLHRMWRDLAMEVVLPWRQKKGRE